MNISLKRIFTLSKLKLNTLYLNQMVTVSLLFPIIIASAGFLVYKKFLGGITPANTNMLMINASLVNVIYLGIFVPAVLMAEEKEKNTLRVLMVSSISIFEYFIGTLIPNILVMTAIQLFLIPTLEISVTGKQLMVFGFVSLITILISSVIGMYFGLLLKDQMSATLAPLPIIFLLWMIPLFSGVNDTMRFISDLFYSFLLPKLCTSLVYGKTSGITVMNWIVFFGELLVVVMVFGVLYKKNGHEND